MSDVTYVLLDTNLLPSSGNLESAFWRSVRQLCHVKGHRLALVDVVLNEDVNRKVELAQGWSKALSEAQKGLSSYISFSTYIPSPEAVGNAWRDTLAAAFEILPVHGDDAIEALRREALRLRPAQAGKGARDSAIWLTAVRLVREGCSVVLLTNNTEDFGRGGLYKDLSRDLEGLPGSLEYLVNMQHFVDSVAEKVKPWHLDEDHFATLYDSIARDHLTSYFDVIDHDSVTDEDLESGLIAFSQIRIVSAFLVEGRGFARLTGRFTFARPEGPEFVSAQFDTWAEFEASTNELVPTHFDDLNIDVR